MPGPVPKRSHQRRRRVAPGNRPERVEVVGAVEIPPAEESWHPIARAWYVSLGVSAQVKFYEPSDWAQARLWAEVLSRQLAGRPSASMMATWQTAANDLLTTEASRRRVRVEVDRRALHSVPAELTGDQQWELHRDL